MTTPAPYNEQLLMDLTLLGEILSKIDNWIIAPDQWALLRTILNDLDAAYDSKDATRIGLTADLLADIDPEKRHPLSGISGARDDSYKPPPQIPVQVKALVEKNESARRKAEPEHTSEDKGAGPK